MPLLLVGKCCALTNNPTTRQSPIWNEDWVRGGGERKKLQLCFMAAGGSTHPTTPSHEIVETRDSCSLVLCSLALALFFCCCCWMCAQCVCVCVSVFCVCFLNTLFGSAAGFSHLSIWKQHTIHVPPTPKPTSFALYKGHHGTVPYVKSLVYIQKYKDPYKYTSKLTYVESLVYIQNTKIHMNTHPYKYTSILTYV
jgi:hypothetical protein